MKRTRSGRQLKSLTIAGILVTGTVSAANDALSYYPTSVVPTLPSLDEIRATHGEATRGILSTLQSAYRDSVGQGWVGVPARDRRPRDETAAATKRPLEAGASSAPPIGLARSAQSRPKNARPDEAPLE